MADNPLEEVGKTLENFADIFEGANLGMATTEELFRELIARFTISGSSNNVEARLYIECAVVLAEMLGTLSVFDKEYKTVGG